MTEQTTPNRPKFADELIALGQHLKLCQELPAIGNIKDSYYRSSFVAGLDIQLNTGSGLAFRLAAWARTLTDVSSDATRMKSGSIHGHVYGLLDGVPVRVWGGDLPGELFPDDDIELEWDVTALLQEA